MATRDRESRSTDGSSQRDLSQFLPPLSTDNIVCPFCGERPAHSVLIHAPEAHPERFIEQIEQQHEKLERLEDDLERLRAEIEAHEYDLRRKDRETPVDESKTAPGPLTDTEYDPGAVDGRHCAGCGEHVSRQYVRVNGENDNITLPHCAKCRSRSERY